MADATAPCGDSSTVNPCTEYQYQSLPLEHFDNEEIRRVPSKMFTRLLTIYPGDFDDEITVDLSVVTLQQSKDASAKTKSGNPKLACFNGTGASQSFDALSYVWGPSGNPSAVFVGAARLAIPINQNLDNAIRHLRYFDRPRIMWIDALCINQSDRAERSRLVRYMSCIYWSSSTRVVVWLGPEAHGSKHAMRTFRHIGSRIRISLHPLECEGLTDKDDRLWGKPGVMPLTERQWVAVGAFVRRPWFERVWIRQEIFEAGDEAHVICGKMQVSWTAFWKGVFRCCLASMDDTLPRHAHNLQPTTAALIVSVFYSYKYSIRRLRASMIGAKCTDPRDRLFGVLGMLHETPYLSIVPDYSTPVAETFRDIALKYYRTRGSLDLLQESGVDGLDLDIPTWVPDWTTAARGPGWRAYREPYVPFRAHIQYLGHGVLRAAGTLLDVVETTVSFDVFTRAGLAASIRTVEALAPLDKQYAGGGSSMHGWALALWANMVSSRTIPPSVRYLDCAEYVLELERLMNPQSTEIDKRQWRLVMRLQEGFSPIRCASRFFVTRIGLLGWGPTSIQRGDRIAALLGCDWPVVLRPDASSEAERHKLVGISYVQGYMHGESFLGHLPDGVSPVLDTRAERGTPRFHMMDTNVFTRRDPRLEGFPGVSVDDLKRWEEEERLFEVDLDILLSRGVDMRNFDLV